MWGCGGNIFQSARLTNAKFIHYLFVCAKKQNLTSIKSVSFHFRQFDRQNRSN